MADRDTSMREVIESRVKSPCTSFHSYGLQYLQWTCSVTSYRKERDENVTLLSPDSMTDVHGVLNSSAMVLFKHGRIRFETMR